jgi:hypothetical protein
LFLAIGHVDLMGRDGGLTVDHQRGFPWLKSQEISHNGGILAKGEKDKQARMGGRTIQERETESINGLGQPGNPDLPDFWPGLTETFSKEQ